ncbi:hypothetical protein [Limisphaera sp. VF-2]|uniref:hypothetical protein n=1 Tax=Limisphaera sp. VF-2 TaxID=3400418 RepID=UPI00175B523B
MGWCLVVERELRAAARGPGLCRWRVALPTAVVVLTLPNFIDWSRVGSRRRGDRAGGFSSFWSGIFLVVCRFSGVVTGDCIRRERREGTPGLLFLMEVKPGAVLTGKWLARSLTI